MDCHLTLLVLLVWIMCVTWKMITFEYLIKFWLNLEKLCLYLFSYLHIAMVLCFSSPFIMNNTLTCLLLFLFNWKKERKRKLNGKHFYMQLKGRKHNNTNSRNYEVSPTWYTLILLLLLKQLKVQYTLKQLKYYVAVLAANTPVRAPLRNFRKKPSINALVLYILRKHKRVKLKSPRKSGDCSLNIILPS